MSFFFFFKQKTAYEIRKGDWSSDVCSSDLSAVFTGPHLLHGVCGPVKTAEQPYGLFDREFVGELRILQLNPQALAQGAGARTPRPAHPEDLNLASIGGGKSLED